MLVCQFCGATGSLEDGEFQIDRYSRGYWCETCDGYTYLENTHDQHRFTLILEEKRAAETPLISSQKKFNKRLSPYRYPGGKSKIIDYLYLHLQQTKSKKLISPFTGGGSFELAMLEAGIVEELHLNDLDTGVYSLWWTIKHMPYEIIDRIQKIRPTHNDYFNAQQIIFNDYKGMNIFDAAWCSLLVNRLSYSGIFKANPLGGKHGSLSKLLARWNPHELVKRIEKIHDLSDRIEITNVDAVELIEEKYWENHATIFIDPPYVNKGKMLYHRYYTREDHIRLAMLLDSLYKGCPGADILVTYDYNEWLYHLYEYPETEKVGRVYSA